MIYVDLMSLEQWVRSPRTKAQYQVFALGSRKAVVRPCVFLGSSDFEPVD